MKTKSARSMKPLHRSRASNETNQATKSKKPRTKTERCSSIFGGARRCQLSEGHDGEHSHSGLFWLNLPCDVALGVDTCTLPTGHDGPHRRGGLFWEATRNVPPECGQESGLKNLTPCDLPAGHGGCHVHRQKELCLVRSLAGVCYLQKGHKGEHAFQDSDEEVIGQAIQDGRRDVALALVDIVRGGKTPGNEALVQRIVDDPHVGIRELLNKPTDSIPLILFCPVCHTRHIDQGRFATLPHKTHSCQNCGVNWAPAAVPTVGVQFLPGCKDEEKT